MMKVCLVTGAAGFIGFHLSRSLLEHGYQVIGLDNLNDYYEVQLKKDRLSQLDMYDKFHFTETDLANKDVLMSLFQLHSPQYVVHLAAQAGVRYSIENPDAYIQSNLVGTFHILEACRRYPVIHLIYASSSSVYGANKKVPFEESDHVDHPVSLYAATKKSNELMAHSYSHLYQIPASGLRFFTVYGPWGRPDMAYFSFAQQHFEGKAIRIFNNGDFENDLYRDFTYIDDIISGIVKLMEHSSSEEPFHKVYNIGNNTPVKLMDFIEALELSFSRAMGKTVVFQKQYEPMKPGDVPATYASTERLEEVTGFSPKTSISEGLQRFADWYVDYYKLK